jgi:hypothetical protein
LGVESDWAQYDGSKPKEILEREYPEEIRYVFIAPTWRGGFAHPICRERRTGK